MKKILFKNSLLVFLVFLISFGLLFGPALIANATTPTLSVSGTSNDSVQITVYGDPNTSVFFYYQGSNYYGQQSQYLGTTNYSGYYSTIINRSSYNINPGASVYVIVNGQQSSSVAWPYNYGYNYNYPQQPTAITFSQSNVNLAINQTVTVSIYGGSAGNYYNYGGNYYGQNYWSGANYYIAYNSNYASVRTTINNNVLTLTGLSDSATAIVICSYSNSCGAINLSIGSISSNNYQNYQYNPYGYNNQNWTYCSGENQYCYFTGTKTVRYGANNNYYYKTLSNGTFCSNDVFGDPAFGIVKQCSLGN